MTAAVKCSNTELADRNLFLSKYTGCDNLCHSAFWRTHFSCLDLERDDDNKHR